MNPIGPEWIAKVVTWGILFIFLMCLFLVVQEA
jgi:hypothetical protein